jgi:hypothetical protein
MKSKFYFLVILRVTYRMDIYISLKVQKLIYKYKRREKGKKYKKKTSFSRILKATKENCRIRTRFFSDPHPQIWISIVPKRYGSGTTFKR